MSSSVAEAPSVAVPASAAAPLAASSSVAAPPTSSCLPADACTPNLTSWVWRYFRLSDSNPGYAFCTLCSSSTKVKVKRTRGNTTNLALHLRVEHSVKEPVDAATVNRKKAKFISTLGGTAEPCSPAFQASADALLAQFFIANCLAFNVTDSESFLAFTHHLTNGAYVPAGRFKLTNTIDTMYHAMIDVLITDVKDNTISITTDAATLDNGQSYIAITAHYLTQHMVMRDVTLCVQRLTQSHTGEYVSDLLDMTLAKWQAEDRCFACVTDNGANFVKAARLATKVQDELRCACHTLQLAVKENFLSDALLTQLCKDAQHIVVVIRRSHLLSTELMDIQKLEAAAAAVDEAPDSGAPGAVITPSRALKLALNVETRFNSFNILFSRLLEVRSAVEQVCRTHATDFSGRALTPEQWDMISEISAVLTPVQELITTLEECQTPSLSLLIPLIMQLCHVLATVYARLKLETMRTVCAKMRQSVYDRFVTALKDPPIMIAMMLDPRARNFVIPGYDETLAVSELRAAFLRFPATLAQYRGQSVTLRHGSNQVDEVRAPEQKKVKLLQMTQKRAAAANNASELDIYLLEDGIDFEECPLAWWMSRRTRFPVLFEMARVYLAIPASSCPSERVFSVGTLVLTDKRRQLHESRVPKLMFMKRNMKLYKQLKANNTNK